MAKTQNEAINDLTKIISAQKLESLNDSKTYTDEEITKSKTYTDEEITKSKTYTDAILSNAEIELKSEYEDGDINLKKYTDEEITKSKTYLETGYKNGDIKVASDAIALFSETLTLVFDDATTEIIKVGK